MSARHDLEHRLWKILKNENAAGKTFVLSCSGGADSVALVRAFAAVQPASRLTVVHAHHGAADGGQGAFRDAAAGFVAGLARELGLDFEMRRHEGSALRSEQDLRRFRRRVLAEIRETRKADLIVTGHHREDLLETRLIRLLRGTGAAGLPAIHVSKGFWFRPFLGMSVGELRSYLESLSQDFLEDPSNDDTRFLRNWVRRVWLPALEARRPGAVSSLGRSLETLTASLGVEPGLATPELDRGLWEAASAAGKLRLLAMALRAAGQIEMTRGQLEEIRRRLDNPQKEHIFVVAGCEWVVNAQRIFARKRG